MVYEHESKQYLVIMAGGHHFMKTAVCDYVIAYALPDDVIRSTALFQAIGKSLSAI